MIASEQGNCTEKLYFCNHNFCSGPRQPKSKKKPFLWAINTAMEITVNNPKNKKGVANENPKNRHANKASNYFKIF